MINLIKKELIIFKKYFLYVILYSIFAVIAFSTSVEMAKSSYIITAVAITYMFIQYSCAIEDKNKSDRILNSLPINRASIVLAKYSSTILFSILSVIAVGLSGLLASSLSFVYIEKIGVEDIVGIFTSTWLLMAFYLPIYFKFGYIKAKLFNMAIFFTFFFGPLFLNDYLPKYMNNSFIKLIINYITSKGILAISGVIIFINIILLIVSALISTKVYYNREFN